MDTFDDFAAFEKAKHKEFFLPYYQENGWVLLQDNLGKNTDWDVKIFKDGHDYTIDEKARRKEYNDFLVEIVQDLNSGSKGWLFKKKDYYFYASWTNAEDKEPTSFYVVDALRLRDFVIGNWKDLIPKMEISEKGWGTTLFVKVFWQDLIFTKIAKKII